MDLSTDLHLAAGLAAVGLGTGVLWRDPRGPRSILFALLCGCLSLWNLGMVGNRFNMGPAIPWNQIFLLGACFTAPLALHFVIRFVGIAGKPVRVYLPLAYGVAGILWLTTWTPFYDARIAWNLTAMLTLGVILSAALFHLIRKSLSLPRGPERTSFRWLIAGSLGGIAGGVSDFIPRGDSGFLKVGPLFLMFFLLIVCATVLRHRFLDVHAVVARGLALLIGAFLLTLCFYTVSRLSGPRFFPLFLTTLLLLAVVGPLGNRLVAGAAGILRAGDPLAGALTAVSRKLPLANDTGALWRAIDEGGEVLSSLRVAIYLRHPEEKTFRAVYPERSTETFPDVATQAPLARLLLEEKAPITRRLLEHEVRERTGEARCQVSSALEEFRRAGFQLVVPLQRGDRLVGWVGVGGRLLERHLTAEVAAAFLAVGNQAMASFERIQANEAARRQEALAAVGRMAAGLAHEIRNPLGAIRGASQVLGAETDPVRAAEMRQVIEEETGRLGRVMGEFLEYARPGTPARKPVDLEPLIRRVLRAAETSGNGIRHELRSADRIPPALGDPDQLQRAFANLVQNARDAAGPEGSLRIDLAADGGDRIRIRFQDDGPGIPQERIGKLFQPFQTTKPGGTGLGLALVHRVVDAHGGRIEVEGRPGQGAAFTLLLRAAEEKG